MKKTTTNKRKKEQSEALAEQRFLLGFLIHDVSALRKKIFDGMFRPLGLNRTQWWTLGNLRLRGSDGMSQGELAKLLEVKKAIMGVMVDQLEEKGLVKRVPEVTDRRVKRIKITRRGHELANMTYDIVKDMTPRMNRDIPDESLDSARATLEKMAENLRQILAEQEPVPEE